MLRKSSSLMAVLLIAGTLLAPVPTRADDEDPLGFFLMGAFMNLVFDCDQKLSKRDSLRLTTHFPTVHPPFDGHHQICCTAEVSDERWQPTGRPYRTFCTGGRMEDEVTGETFRLPNIVGIIARGSNQWVGCTDRVKDGRSLDDVVQATLGTSYRISYDYSVKGNVKAGYQGSGSLYASENKAGRSLGEKTQPPTVTLSPFLRR